MFHWSTLYGLHQFLSAAFHEKHIITSVSAIKSGRIVNWNWNMIQKKQKEKGEEKWNEMKLKNDSAIENKWGKSNEMKVRNEIKGRNKKIEM